MSRDRAWKFFWFAMVAVAAAWFAFELREPRKTLDVLLSGSLLFFVMSGFAMARPLPSRLEKFRPVLYGWYGFWILVSSMTVLIRYCPSLPVGEAALVTLGVMTVALGAAWAGLVSIPEPLAPGDGITVALRAEGSPRARDFALWLGLVAPAAAIVMAAFEVAMVAWFTYLVIFALALVALALRGMSIAHQRRFRFFNSF